MTNETLDDYEQTDETVAFHEAGHVVMAESLGFQVVKASTVRDVYRLGFVRSRVLNRNTDFEGSSRLLASMDAVALTPELGLLLDRLEEESGDREVFGPLRDAIEDFQAVTSPGVRRVLEQKLNEALYEPLIMVAMAGEAAEHLLNGKPEPDWEGGGAGDFADISRYLARLIEGDWVRLVDGEEVETPYSSEAYFDALWERVVMTLRSLWSQVENVAAELRGGKTLSGDEVHEIIRRTRDSALEARNEAWRAAQEAARRTS